MFSFINFSHYAGRMVFYPYEWDPYEAYPIYHSWRFINGESLYQAVSVYPMHVLSYPPLYFLLCGLLIKIAGPCFWPARLLSTVSALTIGGLIYLAIRSDKRSRFWAIAGALLFFASPGCAGYFLPMVRVDSLMLALSLAGLYFTRRALNSRFYGLLAVIFYLLAVYTKQSAIIMVAAGLMWLFTMDRRRALVMGLTLVISGVCLFAFINQATQGEFYHHIIALTAGKIAPGLMRRLVTTFFSRWMIFLAAAVVGLLAIIHRRENTIWAYFFVFSLIHIPMSSRHGAFLNYYLPIIAALSIICGREAGQLDKRLGMVKHPLVARMGLVTLVAIGLLAANLQQYIVPGRTDHALMRGYRKAFKNMSGDLLMSEAHSLAFMNGKSVFIFPMTLQATCGPTYPGIDQSIILQDIAKRRFTYILDNYNYNYWSPAIVESISENYKPQAKIKIPNWKGGEDYLIWVPKNK